jgi:hypothetical protein
MPTEEHAHCLCIREMKHMEDGCSSRCIGSAEVDREIEGGRSTIADWSSCCAILIAVKLTFAARIVRRFTAWISSYSPFPGFEYVVIVSITCAPAIS